MRRRQGRGAGRIRQSGGGRREEAGVEELGRRRWRRRQEGERTGLIWL